VVGYNVTVSFERIWWKIVKRVCPICGDSKKAFLQYVTCSIPRLQCRKIYLIEQLISKDIFKVPCPHLAMLRCQEKITVLLKSWFKMEIIIIHPFNIFLTHSTKAFTNQLSKLNQCT